MPWRIITYKLTNRRPNKLLLSCRTIFKRRVVQDYRGQEEEKKGPSSIVSGLRKTVPYGTWFATVNSYEIVINKGISQICALQRKYSFREFAMFHIDADPARKTIHRTPRQQIFLLLQTFHTPGFAILSPTGCELPHRTIISKSAYPLPLFLSPFRQLLLCLV